MPIKVTIDKLRIMAIAHKTINQLQEAILMTDKAKLIDLLMIVYTDKVKFLAFQYQRSTNK